MVLYVDVLGAGMELTEFRMCESECRLVVVIDSEGIGQWGE
jgi:nitrate reductase NapAB chaperone NapD